MRKLILSWPSSLVVHVALLFVQRPEPPSRRAGDAVTVGIVFDVGGRGDKSFNDGAYAGAERAEKELGAHVRFIEPGEGADREAGLRLLAAEGMDLVIGVGFIFTDDLTQLAQGVSEHRTSPASTTRSRPTRTATSIPPPPNLAALKFREEEGSFLVGALAALVGKSKKVGFVGGMDIPLIHKFEAGYRAGREDGLSRLHGDRRSTRASRPRRSAIPARARSSRSASTSRASNVIFHASGSTGLGVFEAARADGQARDRRRRRSVRRGAGPRPDVDGQGRRRRGVRRDQAREGRHVQGRHLRVRPRRRMASATSTTTNNRALIPDSVRARVEQLKAGDHRRQDRGAQHAMSMTDATRCRSLAVRLTDIHKSFGPVRANRGATLEVARGEIHALVGENGAGKSTLMRVLAGMYAPDAGTMEVNGRDVTGWSHRRRDRRRRRHGAPALHARADAHRRRERRCSAAS